eukprot:Trichotokara_eunicae@DN7100_c0_g1_i1.p1
MLLRDALESTRGRELEWSQKFGRIHKDVSKFIDKISLKLLSEEQLKEEADPSPVQMTMALLHPTIDEVALDGQIAMESPSAGHGERVLYAASMQLENDARRIQSLQEKIVSLENEVKDLKIEKWQMIWQRHNYE